jgi:hypothetical protein
VTDALVTTRLALHGAAELLLAGPQYRRTGKIGLKIVPGGFATTREPALAVLGAELVLAERRIPLVGRFADVAERAELHGAGPLRDVYSGSPEFSLDDAIEIDPDCADTILGAYEVGDAALRTLSADQQPILWPEHFDVGVTIDGVNYGVSPGDAGIPAPYAYVGPQVARVGPFWDVPFGSARLMSQFEGIAAVAAYFEEGRRHAAQDPRQ